MQWKFQKILKEFWLQVLSEKKLALILQYSRYRLTVLWDNLGNVLPTLKRSSKFLAFLIVLSWSRNQSLLRHTNKKENIVILLAAFLVRIPLRFLKNSLIICFLRQKDSTVVLWHFWSEKTINNKFVNMHICLNVSKILNRKAAEVSYIWLNKWCRLSYALINFSST